MSRVQIVPPHPTEVLFIAENLRAPDRQEMAAVVPDMKPTEAVFRSWAVSEVAYVAQVDGIPAIIFGATPDGCVWMVCTDDIKKAPLEILRLSKRVIQGFLKLYPVIWNQADCRNSLHLRWVTRLGFNLGPFAYVNGYPFRQFYLSREEASSCATQPSSSPSSPLQSQSEPPSQAQ
jgi:hypothetical protein